MGISRKLNSAAALLCLLLFISRIDAQEGGRTYTGPVKRKPVPVKPKQPKPAPPEKMPEPVPEPPPKPTLPSDAVPALTLIPAGSFSMGSDGKRPNEAPVHKVEVDSFEIGKFEVTNYEFKIFTEATGYKTDAERLNNVITWRSYYIEGRDKFPVVLVSWSDASRYCKWLSEATGENYRLPTEAEWEYAARGGLELKKYPLGDEIDQGLANYDAEEKRIIFTGVALDFVKPVGSYQENGYGIYDMAGNVWEWTNDWFDDKYYASSPEKNPAGPESGNFKVMRGGGWVNDDNSCRVSIRNFNTAYFMMPYIGFRIVKTPSSAAAPPHTKTDADGKPPVKNAEPSAHLRRK